MHNRATRTVKRRLGLFLNAGTKNTVGATKYNKFFTNIATDFKITAFNFSLQVPFCEIQQFFTLSEFQKNRTEHCHGRGQAKF